MQLDHIRFEGGFFRPLNWQLFKVTGGDSFRFLQSQLTNDLRELTPNSAQLTCRLNRAGMVLSYLYVAKVADYYFLFIPKRLANLTISDLEKYIIAEDIQIEFCCREFILLISPLINNVRDIFNEQEMFRLSFLGEDALLLWGENLNQKTSFQEINGKDIEQLQFLSGYPTEEEILDKPRLVNEFFLNEIAVSYKKGCYLGQEAVCKIQNFRGPSYYTVLLKVDSAVVLEERKFEVEGRSAGSYVGVCEMEGTSYIKAFLFRDFRWEGRLIRCPNFQAEVVYFPFFKLNTHRDKAQELFHRAVKKFGENEDNLAIDLLERSIEIDATFPDSYEALGVIFGRQGRFEEAISQMDKLLGVDSGSMLAHTNKSLFLMKLGRREEAELEKQKALEKKHENKAQIKNPGLNLEMERKETMFKKVLELDPNDIMANLGISEIYFAKELIQEALYFADKVLINDPNNSKAYLLLGKILEGKGDIPEAKVAYSRGIEEAAKKGQAAVVNEIGQRLSKLP